MKKLILFIVLVLGLSGILNAQIEEEIFQIAEEMPRFPGCDDKTSNAKRQECSRELLNNYIKNNLVYPKEALFKKTEGKVIVKFVVSNKGEIKNITVLRDIGHGCGVAAVNLIKSMNNMLDKWTPGKQGGRKISAWVNLPVIFNYEEYLKNPKRKQIELAEMSKVEDVKEVFEFEDMIVEEADEKSEIMEIADKPLEDKVVKKTEIEELEEEPVFAVMEVEEAVGAPPSPPPPPSENSQSNVFRIVEQMPRFPGCEEKNNKREKQQCSKNKLLTYISSKLIYPVKARINKAEGLVVVKFVVTKKGNIKNIKVLRDIGHGCGEAAVHVIESMNNMPKKWIPGRQRGEMVNVYFTLPIKFRL